MMATDNEVQIDLESGEAIGSVLITDLGLLLQPSLPGQLYKVSHDTAHVYRVFNLGATWEDSWAIATDLPFAQAKRTLDPVFYAFANGYSMAEVWVLVRVVYIGAGGVELFVTEHGMEDGQETFVFQVFTAEFWGKGNKPSECDWSPVLNRLLVGDVPEGLGCAAIEEFLASREPTDRRTLVVVRPDEAEDFRARAFRV